MPIVKSVRRNGTDSQKKIARFKAKVKPAEKFLSSAASKNHKIEAVSKKKSMKPKKQYKKEMVEQKSTQKGKTTTTGNHFSGSDSEDSKDDSENSGDDYEPDTEDEKEYRSRPYVW